MELKEHKFKGRNGCDHYKRRCCIHCNQCDEWHICKHCHNREHELTNEHRVEADMVDIIMCMNCQTKQQPSNKCVQCNIQFAKSYCDKCYVWTEVEDIFHCDGCKLCRVGKRENFTHCDKCNICIRTSSFEEHTKICLKQDNERKCICFERTQDSRKLTVVSHCGHQFHKTCYIKMQKSGRNTCPYCSKYMIDPNNEAFNRLMNIHREKYEESLQGLTIGKEIKWLCNQCGHKFKSKIHTIYGSMCPECRLFNVTRV
jgi:RING finger/CHY zinc finger protein 1